MPRGAKPGERRSGRRPGSRNKPKGRELWSRLENAEKEVRAIIMAGDKIAKSGKDRLAEPSGCSEG
jgi:hypothetical protein